MTGLSKFAPGVVAAHGGGGGGGGAAASAVVLSGATLNVAGATSGAFASASYVTGHLYLVHITLRTSGSPADLTPTITLTNGTFTQILATAWRGNFGQLLYGMTVSGNTTAAINVSTGGGNEWWGGVVLDVTGHSVATPITHATDIAGTSYGDVVSHYPMDLGFTPNVLGLVIAFIQHGQPTTTSNITPDVGWTVVTRQDFTTGEVTSSHVQAKVADPTADPTFTDTSDFAKGMIIEVAHA